MIRHRLLYYILNLDNLMNKGYNLLWRWKMTAKVISISLTEAQAWKLEQLEVETGISRSGLMQRALMYLVLGRPASRTFPNMSDAFEGLESEYNSRRNK